MKRSNGAHPALEKDLSICPTFALMVNNYEFSQPSDANHRHLDLFKRIVEDGAKNLQKAKAAGVRFLAGTDSGFAITPYGEWHARELEFYVDLLGFTPGEALRIGTANTATMLRHARDVCVIEA